MIKLSELNQVRIVRETKAPFLNNDESQEIRVRYFALSLAEGRKYQADIAAKGNNANWADILLPLVESLPDICDSKGKPVAMTAKFLESLNTVNLRAIHAAIGEDLAPKFQSAK